LDIRHFRLEHRQRGRSSPGAVAARMRTDGNDPSKPLAPPATAQVLADADFVCTMWRRDDIPVSGIRAPRSPRNRTVHA
jgi:hypothetical protein